MSIEIYWFAYNQKMAKHGKLNFGYNMTIFKSVVYGDFGDPTSRDRDLGTLKTRKNGHFSLENLLIRLEL